MSKVDVMTLFCGVLIILSSCLFFLINHSQKSIIISAFFNIVGLTLLVSSLTDFQKIQSMWLVLISTLLFVVIWTGLIHLYYRKVIKN